MRTMKTKVKIGDNVELSIFDDVYFKKATGAVIDIEDNRMFNIVVEVNGNKYYTRNQNVMIIHE